MMYTDCQVYIEGIQIPFTDISINQAYKQRPTATISIPPFPGLCDIGRNYQPKVHVFYQDYNFGVNPSKAFPTAKERDDAVKSGYKLIFSGVITGNSDSKSVSASGGSQRVTLTAEHHSNVLDQILFKFGNAAQESRNRTTDGTNSSGIAVVGELTKSKAMVRALEGILENAEEKVGDKIDIRYAHGEFQRLKGIPSLMVVLWNMLKRDAQHELLSKNTEALTDMYIPLIEEGIKFWKRVTGHSLIEGGLDNDKVIDTDTTDVDDEDATNRSIIPPLWKTFLGDAAQIKAAQSALRNMDSGTPSEEVYSYGEHVAKMFESIEYEMITLASPIVTTDGKITEYIVKPSITNYYAPICNVLLPNLITSVEVNNGYRDIPTRINCIQNSISGGSTISVGGTSYNYAAPHSVRKARAGKGSNLSQSTASFTNKVGKYEWGQGIRSRTAQMPSVYSLLQSIMSKRELEGEDDSNISDHNLYNIAVDAWNNLYGDSDKFNPLKKESEIKNFQRLPFLYVDSLFAKSTAKARSASVQGVFNPYPVVGYPMDVVDSVPSRESYHGICISITHNISASGSSSTSYTLASVSTFAELAKFNLPAVNPYLMAVLGFQNDVRIYGNKTAYETACKLYADVFEVGAAEPSMLQNYDTGTMRNLYRTGGFWGVENDAGVSDSVLGSLNLVARNIQSLGDVEKDTDNKFISIDDWRDLPHNSADEVKSHYRVGDASISDGKISTPGQDIESSPFLTYPGDE